MIKKYINKEEIADQDKTHVLLYSGELLKLEEITTYNPYNYNRIKRGNGSNVVYHMNGCPAASPRPYGYLPN